MAWTSSQWRSAWWLVKDIILTAAGLAVILSQLFSQHPSTEALLAGLALTGLGATFHVGSLMSGSFGGRASHSASQSSSPPSPPHGGDDR